jgi:tRNA pseudouridine(38-40) synthase
MPRFRAIVEYDGTDFLGFQRQAQGRTVQGELEAALSRIGWAGTAVLGAGRTDAGVHAAGQVIAFDFEWQHGDGDLVRALNANLPEDVAIKQAETCPPDFHPRFAAKGTPVPVSPLQPTRTLAPGRPLGLAGVARAEPRAAAGGQPAFAGPPRFRRFWQRPGGRHQYGPHDFAGGMAGRAGRLAEL